MGYGNILFSLYCAPVGKAGGIVWGGGGGGEFRRII